MGPESRAPATPSLRVPSSPAGGPGSRKGRAGRGGRKRPTENMAAAASRHLCASRRPLRWPLGVNTLLGRRFASSASWSHRGINPETEATLSGRGGGTQRGAVRGRPALARVGGADRRAIAIHATHSMYACVRGTYKLQFVLGSDPVNDAVGKVLLPEGGWTKGD